MSHIQTTQSPTASSGKQASNVPLGFVSFTENDAMVAMALWMGAKHLL